MTGLCQRSPLTVAMMVRHGWPTGSAWNLALFAKRGTHVSWIGATPDPSFQDRLSAKLEALKKAFHDSRNQPVSTDSQKISSCIRAKIEKGLTSYSKRVEDPISKASFQAKNRFPDTK
ncbi:MAG: hypothetical protein ACK587_10980 [Cyanobacteriota bacterium]